jgi:hypothetical protein
LSLTFSGDRLRAVEGRPPVTTPLPGILAPGPHLHVLIGRPEVGKTSLAAWVVLRWVLGLPAWEGAPDLPGSRALVLSREQEVRQLYSLLSRLAPEGREDWADRVHVVARDNELPKALLQLLTLHDTGLAVLRSLLTEAAPDPFGLLVLDSLSRLKPPDVEENDNDGMTQWLDKLEELAIKFGAYVLLLHHAGHGGEGRSSDPRSAGRGASAIGAVSAAQLLLEVRQKRERILRVEGNFVLGGTTTFEVADDSDHEDAIRYFRPNDPFAGYHASDYLKLGEPISTNDLAWCLSRKQPESGKNPPGTATRLASILRDRWLAQGTIDVLDGPRGAKMLRLRADLATSPGPRPSELAKSGTHLATAPKKARGGEVEEVPGEPAGGEETGTTEPPDPGDPC